MDFFIYSFTINSYPPIYGTIRLPMKGNMVVFGRFRPDNILNKLFRPHRLTGVLHYEIADEFKKDCIAIINRVNANILNYDLQSSFEKALIYVIVEHINKFNRIFINDLMAYIDAFCELRLAIDWDNNTPNREYPSILLGLVERYNNYVLEEFNDLNGNHIPFKSSVRYNNLVNHVTSNFTDLVNDKE